MKLLFNLQETKGKSDGRAKLGTCPVNCMKEFYFFLIVMCVNKFLGGTEGGANFLLSLRSVFFIWSREYLNILTLYLI